jgi:site-specific DNA recombinase
MQNPKPTKPLRYIAYLRKSEERKERQILSIDSQRERIKKMFPDLKIIDWVEETRSAFTPYNRPEFDRMIKRIESGEADGIVSWYPNRLSRNEIEAATITYGIRSGTIKDLKFCTYTFENNPPGIWMLQMLLSHGQLESAKQGVDVARGMETKARGGEKPGQVPQGYIKVPLLDENGNTQQNKFDRIITKTADDPERFHLVAKMWHMLLYENYTPPQIRKIANEEWKYTLRQTESTGGGPMGYSTIYRIFNNPFYAGWMRHRDELHKGHHNPMISLEQYDYAQRLLGKNGKPRQTAHDFAYGSMVRCGECGCQIVAKATPKFIKTTKEIKTYVHYYCTRKSLKRPCNQHKYTTLADLELEIDAELARYTILPEFKDEALRILRRNNKLEVKTRTQIYETQQNQRRKIQEQIDKLTDRLTRGVVEEDDYIRQRNTLKAQLSETDGGLRSTEKRAEEWLKLTEKAFDFATYARARFADTTDHKLKRDILQTLGTNFTLKDNKLTLTPHEWLIPLERDYPTLERAYRRVGTDKKATTTAVEAAFASIFESWRAQWDSNPRHAA